MVDPTHIPGSNPGRRPLDANGFTIVEVVVALGVLGLAVGSSLLALARMDDRAMDSRLETCAQTAAQNQIDRILYETYLPQNGIVPRVLRPTGQVLAAGATGAHFWNAAEEAKPEAATNRENWYSTTIKTVPIYDPDPAVAGEKGETNGTVQITVTNPGATQGGDPLHLLRATVTARYAWRGQNRTCTLSSIRTADL